MTNGSERIHCNSSETVDNLKPGKRQQESRPASSITSCTTTPSLDSSSRLRKTLNSLELGNSNPTESTLLVGFNQPSDRANDDYDENDGGGLIKNGNNFWSYSTKNKTNGYQHQHHRLRTILIFLVAGCFLFGLSLATLGASYHYYHLASSSNHPSNNNNNNNRTRARARARTHDGVDVDGMIDKKREAALNGLPNGAVASDHPMCSRLGADILSKQGGNAVDAAVATVLCLGVANPASSGLGGGAFLLIRSSKAHFEEKQQQQKSNSSSLFVKPLFDDARDHTITNDQEEEDPDFVTEVVDCRETAPEKASRDMYVGLPILDSYAGGLAIAVPGELRGLELAHSRHGKLSWREVVEPARRLAQDGVLVGKHLAGDIDGLFSRFLPKISKSSDNFLGIQKYLSSHNDNNPIEYLREGELLQNPALAKVLRKVAEQGADALYRGKNAENLVRDVQEAGGILTLEDLETYRATLRSPIRAKVSGYSVVGIPPPSSGGGVVVGIARFLSGYSRPLAAAADTLSVHRMVEGMRHAFSIRMSLSDPAFNGNVTRDAVRDLTSNGYMESLRQSSSDKTTLDLSHYGGPKWAQMHDEDGAKETVDAHEGDRRQRRRLVRNEERQSTKHSGLIDNTDSTDRSDKSSSKNKNMQHRRLARPFGYLEDNGTSHLSVVDKDGNAVAVTTSINEIFGSKVFSESTGVMLGNTMDDFGVPGKPNLFGLKPAEANFIVPGKRVSSNRILFYDFLQRTRNGLDWYWERKLH